MASTKSKSSTTIGVPVQLLYEAEGLKLTVECNSGDIYRGLLVAAEDTMNLTLSGGVLRTARNGQVTQLPSAVYLKGTSIRLIALPSLLKSAPLLQQVSSQKRTWEKAQAHKMGQSAGGGNKKRKTMD